MTHAENDRTRAQRAEALIARMKQARGYIYPEWEFAARQDPDFVETYNRIYEHAPDAFGRSAPTAPRPARRTDLMDWEQPVHSLRI